MKSTYLGLLFRSVLPAISFHPAHAGYIVRGCGKLVINPDSGEPQMARSRAATAADAEICMKLYDLRRESEMRKARNFVNYEFQPKGIDDALKLMQSMGTQENAWARQVFSFWEYAASLVVNKILHPDLFLTWNGESVFVYAKFKPFLKQIRLQMENPAFLANVEKVVNSSPEALKRVAMIQKRLAKVAEQGQAAKAK